MKKYSQQDQRSMAAWAADRAERVLPFFENAYPKDDRPQSYRSMPVCGLFRA
jgi:hypothetical protein